MTALLDGNAVAVDRGIDVVTSRTPKWRRRQQTVASSARLELEAYAGKAGHYFVTTKQLSPLGAQPSQPSLTG